MQQSDEYVIEALIDHEKIQQLIYDLITVETWKEKVYPLVEDLASSFYVKLYLILYHEAIVLGLLEKAFYHSSAVTSGGDLLIELADYCYRKTVLLNTIDAETFEGKAESLEAMLSETEVDRLKEQQKQLEFACAISSLTVLRFMSENVSSISLSVVSRLLAEQDILQTVVPLLDQPPWCRTRKGVLQRYSDGRWSDVSSDDVHRVCKTEAQVWLLLNNVLLDKDCRSKYVWTEHSKNNVMRLSKFFNEVLVDQLPVLSQLRRFVETLAFAPPPSTPPSGAVVIEQVPQVRQELLGADFKAVAAAFRSSAEGMTEEERREEMRGLADMYAALDLDRLLPDPTCALCGL